MQDKQTIETNQEEIFSMFETMWQRKCANVTQSKTIGKELLNQAATNAWRKRHKVKARKAHMSRI